MSQQVLRVPCYEPSKAANIFMRNILRENNRKCEKFVCRSDLLFWVTQLKFLLFGNSKRTRAPIFLHSRRNDGRQNTGLNWDIPFMCYGESIFTPYIGNWHSWFRWGHGWKEYIKTFKLKFKPPAQCSGSVKFLCGSGSGSLTHGSKSFSFCQCTFKKRLKVIQKSQNSRNKG
jgi:hypothetical protein